ncbi:MAG: hypothetical protein ACYC0M_12015 [Burkholderiales bacterium]
MEDRAKEKSGRKKWWMTLAGQVGKYFRVHVDSVCASRRDAIWQESRTQVAFGIRMALQETVMFIQKAPGENPGLFFQPI